MWALFLIFITANGYDFDREIEVIGKYYGEERCEAARALARPVLKSNGLGDAQLFCVPTGQAHP